MCTLKKFNARDWSWRCEFGATSLPSSKWNFYQFNVLFTIVFCFSVTTVCLRMQQQFELDCGYLSRDTRCGFLLLLSSSLSGRLVPWCCDRWEEMRCVIWDRFYMCHLIGMRVWVIGLSSAFWLIFELGLSAGLFKASPLVVCNTRFLLSVLLLSGYFGATYLLLLGAAVMRERGNWVGDIASFVMLLLSWAVYVRNYFLWLNC